MNIHTCITRSAYFTLLLLPRIPASAQTVVDAPSAYSPIRLSAVTNSTGQAAFLFEGREEPPVIRARLGEAIRITYKNEMQPTTHAKCAAGPCMNMTNLHFHGLHVSPKSPQDDVLSMVAMPGESLEYKVDIPLNQPPGLYWYHPHAHGESYKQVLDGMSGAIVVEGIERYVPEVGAMRQRILVLRDEAVDKNSLKAKHLRELAELVVGPAADTEVKGFGSERGTARRNSIVMRI